MPRASEKQNVYRRRLALEDVPTDGSRQMITTVLVLTLATVCCCQFYWVLLLINITCEEEENIRFLSTHRPRQRVCMIKHEDLEKEIKPIVFCSTGHGNERTSALGGPCGTTVQCYVNVSPFQQQFKSFSEVVLQWQVFSRSTADLP